MVRLVAVDRVLGQGTLSPSVDAANTMNVEVDVEIDKASALNLMRMAGGLKIFLSIIPGTDT